MNRRAINFLLMLGLFVFACFSCALAQDPEDIQQGIKAYGTYRGGEIDTVSMTSGGLSGRIPLVSFPQRGKLHLSYSLVFSRPNFSVATKCGLDGCVYRYAFTTSNFANSESPVVPVPDQGMAVGSVPITNQLGLLYYSYSVLTADGAKHQLAALNSTEYETVDGTGLHAHIDGSNEFLTDAEGTRYGFGSIENYIENTQEDTNGNQISILPSGALLDSVGRTIPMLPSSFGTGGSGNCPSGPLPVYLTNTWVVPGPSGGTSTYLFCWAQVSMVFSYNDNNNPPWSYVNHNFLQSVVLPNGTAWAFQYSTDGWGDLTQITFPTGGTISYVWTGGGGCSSPLSRRLVSRMVNANDGTGSHTWTYSYAVQSSTTSMTVTDPLGNNTVYTNTQIGPCSFYTTSVQDYQGAVQSSNLLKTVSTTYSSTVGPFPSASSYTGAYMNIVPTQITTTWAANGKTSQVTKAYDSGFTFVNPIPGQNNVYTGLYGKVVTQKEYDYGTSSGQVGPLIRQTNTNYAWQRSNPNYSSYLSNNMMNLVYSSQITDGSSQKAYTQYGHDETATITSGMGAAQNLDLSVWTATYRGNQTSVNRWLNLPSVQTLTSTTSYYDTGMPSVAKDPLLNPTTYYYSSTFQDAYVTQVKNALNQSTYSNYDYNTGLLTSTTDVNGQVTTDSYDIDSRVTNVTRPTGGGQTSFCYTDLGGATCSQGSAPYQVVITKAITSAKNETATAIVDGLGRLAHTQLNSDPEGIDYADDTFDAEGNKATTSNPYRTTSDSTYGITTNAYDGLRRVIQVTQADGSLLKTAYCGNTTLVTDEAGHWRRSTVDGLGRLIEVDEPNSTTATVNSNGCPGSNDPVWVTTYGYDTLGNLLSVLQAGSRARSFTYDSLSRLLTASNPESGNLAYTYDSDGNVTTKVSPLQNQTGSATTTLSYCYDALNRLTAKGHGSSQKSCTNGTMTGPDATYSYDGSGCLGAPGGLCYNVGHRTGMTDLAGSESWAYDTMGRTIVQSRTTNSITKTTGYTYNLDGSVATLTYPSGRVVTYTPDTAGRPSSLMDNTTSVYYATGTCANGVSGNGICYAPQGGVAQVQYGTSLVSTHIYNDRLQPCWTYSTTGTPLAWGNTTGCTSTAAAANMLDLKYNFNLGSDNGNPISIINNRVADRSQTFSYDQLNRIATAKTTATHASNPADCWGQAFGYDSTGNWSNLLSISGASSAYTGCTQGALSVAVTTKNQITGDTYDAAGNLMAIPSASANYAYNAENQLCALASNCNSPAYIYDGDGNRVEKSGSKIYWFGGSEILDETDTTGSVTNSSFNEYVFFGSNRIARRDSFGNVFYYLTDQLGSSRVIAEVPSGQTTATLCYDADFEPFGGEHTYTNTCPQNYKFTGKERDTESGLDNFGARYFASTTGRFMTPDWALKPLAVPYANFGDPQTLNLYTYVENSPLNRIDADGHEDNQTRNNGTVASTSDGGKLDSASHCPFGSAGMECNPDPPAQTMSTADKVKTALDVAGFIPVVGDFANLGSAGISAAQGHYGDAALSLLAAIPVVGMVGEIGKGAELVKDAETLTRIGSDAESAARLGRKALEAEEKIGIHGVSATAAKIEGKEVSTASRSAVEQSFNVHNTPTRADPLHRTVELPKPVTKSVADIFNALFGR
jgi:RHS repeat-associated protein